LLDKALRVWEYKKNNYGLRFNTLSYSKELSMEKAYLFNHVYLLSDESLDLELITNHIM